MATFADAPLCHSRKTRTKQGRRQLIRHHPPSAGSPVVLSDKMSGSVARTPPVQRPLARQRVVLSHQVIAYYGRIRVSRALPLIYEFMQRIFPVSLIQGRPERFPNLLRASFPPCRLQYPVGSGRCF